MGVALPRVAGAVSESEERGEGAVVWRSLPAREHCFLAKGFRPSGVRGVPLAARASALAAGLGLEGRQGGELGEVALVEFISILHEGGRNKTREKTCYLWSSVEDSQRRRRRNMEETFLSQLARDACRFNLKLKRWRPASVLGL